MRDGVSNHQPHDCLLNRLFGRRSKKTSKLRYCSIFYSLYFMPDWNHLNVSKWLTDAHYQKSYYISDEPSFATVLQAWSAKCLWVITKAWPWSDKQTKGGYEKWRIYTRWYSDKHRQIWRWDIGHILTLRYGNTLRGWPSQLNANWKLGNSKLTSDSELIW